MSRRLPPMSNRFVTLVIAGVCVFAALVVASVVAVPYVALTPGPTLNTLGPTLNALGRPQHGDIIEITGRRTYPTTGHLNMVTVSYTGGPGTDFNIFSAIRAWLTPDDAVVPQSEIYSAGQTQQQVVKQDTQQMQFSQQVATAAALCYLNISFTTVNSVATTVKGMPAYGVLRAGDDITAVDGKPVTCHNNVVSMVQDRKPGARVTLTIDRKGVTKTVTLATKDEQSKPAIGVQLVPTSYRFPFNIKINLNGIGGPSAGLMFALAIIDKLTPDNLTGGRFIAGTGQIEPNGTIEAIGGIQQKMAGARQAGATIFLTPADNCANTSGAVPSGLRLVKVSSLAQAVRALQTIRQGQTTPSC
jgi:Lon-like protease